VRELPQLAFDVVVEGERRPHGGIMMLSYVAVKMAAPDLSPCSFTIPRHETRPSYRRSLIGATHRPQIASKRSYSRTKPQAFGSSGLPRQFEEVITGFQT
jgi:hypothetical protein